MVQDAGEVDLGADAGPDEAPIIRLVSSILQQTVGEGLRIFTSNPRPRKLR